MSGLTAFFMRATVFLASETSARLDVPHQGPPCHLRIQLLCFFPPSMIPVRRRKVCHVPQHVRMFLPEDPLLRLHDWIFQLLSPLPISNFKEYWSIICPSLAIACHRSPQQGIVLIGHFYMRNKCSTECIIFPGEDKIDRG